MRNNNSTDSSHLQGLTAVLSVRPKVAELVFQVYGRALHPELFQIYQTRAIQRGDYEASLSITSAGHVVSWRYKGLTLTEVAASAQHPLPQKRRLLSYCLKGERTDGINQAAASSDIKPRSNWKQSIRSCSGIFSRSYRSTACSTACCTGSIPAVGSRWGP